MGEPDRTLVVQNHIMRLDLLARQIILGDDDPGGTAGRSGEPLQLVSPCLVFAQVDRGKKLRERPRARALPNLAASIAVKALRIFRGAAWIITAHALKNLHELVGRVLRPHDAVEIVAADAAERRLFLV